MEKPHFSLKLLHPKLWPTWLGFAAWWVLVQVFPYRWQMCLGARLGRLAASLSKRRSLIAQKNIALCLPELSETRRQEIFNQAMESAGKGFFETGMAWFWPGWRLQKIYSIEGLEHLITAEKQGSGVVFLGIHFTTIEIGAAFLNLSHSIDGFYRPHENPVYDYVQRKGRERHNDKSTVIPRSDVRGIIKNLRAGRAINYMTDQDYGRKHSEFVPFFSIPAATVTAPSQYVRAGKALALPYVTGRLEDDTGYYIRVYPSLPIGLGDDLQDALLINQFMEARIRENPGQYLWAHRRFKTRPDGEKDFYKVEHMPWAVRKRKKRHGR